jgi:AraC-like DNA-binding protein
LHSRTVNPIARISPKDLDNLMASLDVEVVALSECLVSRGFGLDLGGIGIPGIHYNLKGTGKMLLSNKLWVNLKPHTLIVVPPNTPFRIEAAQLPGKNATLRLVDGRLQKNIKGDIHRFVAGDDNPEILLICGFFTAVYGASAELFSSVECPIVEQFDENHRLEATLKEALSELVAQEAGSGAMSSALLKQVIITLLRRSLTSVASWVEQFALLSDCQIARAFAEMAAHPGKGHSVDSLAKTACLSRSSFMIRFVSTVGKSPIMILRELRMRQASRQLRLNHLSIEQIARDAGYDSRSSFVRAFRKSFNCDPSEYREKLGKGDRGILAHSAD